MNCETADNLLLDELYGELDEATSAELRQHADDCALCGLGEKLASMKRTREAAAPEYVEPPSDLEDRILAATREIKPAAPRAHVRSVRSKMGGFVSLAGAWAMRPQTAMAAVFLLMIGSSLTFLKVHRSAKSSAVAVSEQGTPSFWGSDQTAANSNAAQNSSTALGGKLAGMVGGSATAAASAYPGLGDDDSTGSSVAATKRAASLEAKDMSAPPPPPSPAAVAMNSQAELGSAAHHASARAGSLDDSWGSGASGGSEPMASRKGVMDPDKVAVMRPSAPKAAAPAGDDSYAPGQTVRSDDMQSAAAPIATALPASAPAAAAPASLASGPSTSSAANAGSASDGASDPVAAGKAALKLKKYTEALADFDSVASGDVNAALLAARTVRDSSGCAAAVGRYDDVAARAPSSTTGYDAKLEAARCYRAMGDADSARARLNPLLTVPSHMDRAKKELAALSSGSARPPAAASKGARGF